MTPSFSTFFLESFPRPLASETFSAEALSVCALFFRSSTFLPHFFPRRPIPFRPGPFFPVVPLLLRRLAGYVDRTAFSFLLRTPSVPPLFSRFFLCEYPTHPWAHPTSGHFQNGSQISPRMYPCSFSLCLLSADFTLFADCPAKSLVSSLAPYVSRCLFSFFFSLFVVFLRPLLCF